MKKLFTLILSVAMMLSLASCGSGSSSENKTSDLVNDNAQTIIDITGNKSTTGDDSTPDPNRELSAAAQAWPTGPITLYCGGKAGGSADLQARLFAEYFSKEVGVPVVIENDSSWYSYEKCFQAEPDGLSLTCGQQGMMVGGMTGSSPYDFYDFTFVGIIAQDVTWGLWAPAEAPYDNVEELIAYCEEHPYELNLGCGSANSTMLEAYGFQQVTGCKLTIVEAGSDADRHVALIGRNIDLIIDNASNEQQSLEEGDVKCITTFMTEESVIKGVQTLKEQGYDWVYPANFNNLCVTSGTDPDVVEKIANAVSNVVSNPEYQTACAGKGVVSPSRTWAEAKAYTDAAYTMIKDLVNQIL